MNADCKLYIVDDDPAARNSLAALVKSRQMAVETYPSAEAFLQAYDPAQPGCLIVDVRMTGMSGLDLLDHVSARGLDLPVIVITGFADVPMAVRAMRAGAVTFLEKPCSEQELWNAIETALDVEARVRSLRHKRSEIEERYANLAPIEHKVLDKMLLGLTNKTIARDLALGLRTVEQRRAKIMAKMGVESLAELVRHVLLIRPEYERP